jgi:hydrogenase maturation protein HypF
MIDDNKIYLAKVALQQKINTPESCSTGRLFDAVSSILGVCTQTTYHAEAPIKLENIVQPNIDDIYPIDLSEIISWVNVIHLIVEDILNGISPGVISTRFHNTVAFITHRAILKIHNNTGINKVMLTGGSFQNKYLTKKLVDLVHKSGLKAYIGNQIPCNDGGIALGQLTIAAKKNSLCV